ncbi:hypothetical protein PMAYCL1PPCAC_10902, partial [Pristionchus mayeri]
FARATAVKIPAKELNISTQRKFVVSNGWRRLGLSPVVNNDEVFKAEPFTGISILNAQRCVTPEVLCPKLVERACMLLHRFQFFLCRNKSGYNRSYF